MLLPGDRFHNDIAPIQQIFLVFQVVFSVIIFHLSRRLEDVFKKYLQYVFQKRFQSVFKMSSRCLQDVFRRPLKDAFARPLLQDVFKTSSRRLQEDVLQLCLEDVLKTSWKTKKCYTEDFFKTFLRRLQYVIIKTNVCWVRCLLKS